MDNDQVAKRAGTAARIFDTVAWIVVVLGTIAAIGTFIGGAFSDEGFEGFLYGTSIAVLIAVYTAITWASITLATAVAGYIANRSQEHPHG
jgi:predicted MFS family arabinose efflux permease